MLLKSTDQSATAGGVQEKHEVFGIDDFQGYDEKVRFFTGLTNWEILSKLMKSQYDSQCRRVGPGPIKEFE